jgi:hypothetical protein
MLHLSPRCCLAYKRRTDLYEQTQTVVESLLSNLAGEFAQVCSRLLIIRDHGPADLPLDKREAKDEEDERYGENVFCCVAHTVPLTACVVGL